MSGRSSTRRRAAGPWLALPCLALGAASCSSEATQKKPEADPAQVGELAATLLRNTPAIAGVPECTPEDLRAGARLTLRTVMQLAGREVPTDATSNAALAEWTNPPTLDAPAARGLGRRRVDEHARRQAAAELLAAPGYRLYRVDSVDVPLAIEVKELKRGVVSARAIKYDARREPVCMTVYPVRNSKEKSDWAMEKSNRVRVDPTIAQALRDELSEQLLLMANWIALTPEEQARAE
jgi:hypothetical protein